MARIKHTSASTKNNRLAQDSMLDRLATGEIGIKSKRSTTPLSLKPGQTIMDGCAEGHPIAIAVRDAWKFNQPVVVMTGEELNRLSERCHVTFVGKESDRA